MRSLWSLAHRSTLSYVLSIHLRPPRSPLFPYTTLFRSVFANVYRAAHHGEEPLAVVPYYSWVAVGEPGDRKSTRLNSSHSQISYAVFCLKKKNLYIDVC